MTGQGKAMNKLIKSLTLLLHAIVITAALSNLTTPDQSSTIHFNQDSARFFYPTEAVATTDL